MLEQGAIPMASFNRLLDLIERIKWSRGGRREWWAANVDMVGQFIKAKGLAATEVHTAGVAEEVAVRSSSKAYWIDPRGGIHPAHLHHLGQIYVLDQKAWKEFSGAVVGQVKEKLASAQAVGFDEVMDTAEAVQMMR
jgi:hypothetical protein